jgi:hypothetical protein
VQKLQQKNHCKKLVPLQKVALWYLLQDAEGDK